MTSKKTTNPELPEELLKHFLDASPYAIAIKDASLKICCANQAYCELHNATVEQIVGTTGFEHLPKAFAAKSKAEEKAVLKSGETLEIHESYPLSSTEKFQVVIKKSVFTTSASTKYLIVQFQDLSEGHKTKDELEKSNQSLESKIKSLEERNRFKDAVLEYTSDAIVLIDEHGTFLYRSSGVEQISGYQDEDLLGQGIFRLIHPDDLNDALNTLRTVVESPNVPISFDHRVKHKEGHYIWLEGTAVNYIADNAVGAIVLNYRDVTYRKTSLNAPKKGGVAYEQLFTSMADMFHIIELVYNDDGKPIDFIEVEVNPAVEKLYGLPSEKIVGQRITSIVGVVEDYWLEVFDTVVKTGKPAYFENYNEGLDRYYRINAWQTPDKKLAVIFADITPRKQAELDLQRNSALLQDAQSIAKLGGWELDLRTNQIYWTEETYHLHEVDPKKWVPTVENGVSFYTPASQKVITKALETAIKNKEDFDVECQFVTAKGNLLDVRATGKTVVEEGEVIKVLGIFQDITDKKQAERELHLKTMLLEDAEAISKLGGWELDLKTGQIYWTENTYRLHEVDPKTWVPTVENGVSFYTEESQKIITAALEKAIENQEDFDVECQFVTAKGNLLDVRATGTTVVEGEEVVKIVGVFQDITSKNQEVLEFRQQKMLLNDAQKLANMGAWELDLQTNQFYFTEQTALIHGFEPNESNPSLESVLAHHTEEDQQRIRSMIEDIVAGKLKAFFLEIPLITDNGTEYQVRITAKPVFSEGKAVKLVGFIQNITEFQRLSEELVRQQILLEDASRLAKFGGWELDILTGELFWTNETYQIFDVQQGEFNPSLDDVAVLFLPESKKKLNKARDNAIKKGIGYDLELEAKTIKGRHIHVRTNAEVTLENGVPNKLIGVIQDITEQKEALQELEKQQLLLEDSQHIAKVGGWELDIASGNLFWTPETYRIHDTSPEEFNPTVDAGVSYFLPDSKKQIEKALDQAINKGVGYDLELDTYTTKGRLITVRTTCVVTTKDGKPSKLTGSFQDITHIKQATKEKEKQRKMLEESQRVAKVGAWQYNTESSTAEVTSEFYRILEVPEFYEGLFFVQLFGFIDFGYRRVLAKEVDKALKTGKGFDVESKVRARSGEIKDVRITCSVIKEKGEPAILNGTLQEITEYKQLQREIEDSQRFFSDSQNAALIGSYRLYVQENRWASSRVLDNIFGVPDDYKKTVESWSQLVHPDDREMMLDYFTNTVLGNKEDFNKEYRIVRPENGETRWVLGLGKVKYIDDQPVEMVGTIQDITNRKMIEQALSKSEERFSQVTEASDIWVWETDANGLYTYVSPNIEKVLGYSPKEVIGKKHYYDLFTDEVREDLKKLVFEVFNKKGNFRNLLNENLHKDGTVVHLETNGFPIIDGNGKLIGYQGSDKDVTERVKQQQEIEECRMFFRESQKAGVIGSYRLDVRTEEWKSSEVLYEIFGISEDYTKTIETWSELIHPDDRQRTVDHFRDVIKNKKDFYSEYRVVRPADGKVRWVLEIAKLNFIEGQPVEMIGTVQDITERKRSEEALRRSEGRFSQVSQASRVCIWEIDNTGVFTYVSQNFASVLGYGQSEVTNKVKLSNLVSSKKQKELRDLLTANAKTQQIVRKQTEFVHKNGSILCAELDAFPVYNEGGDNVGYRGSLKDITERVLQQKEIEKLSEVVSQNPAAVIITDLNGSIEYVNKKFEDVTGYRAVEVLGKNPRILSSGELPKSEYTNLWNTVLSGKPWSGELHNVKKDGSKFWERALIAPIFDENGKVSKLMGLKVDITAEKKFQDELESTLSHLEELVDERTKSLTKAKQDLEVAHKSLLSSLQYAKRIQEASIPSPADLRKEVADAFVIFKPRDMVSGDFYWYHKTENGVVVSLADCTGHGVPGAMLSMIGFELLDHIVRRRRTLEPDVVLEKVNYGVISTLSSNQTGSMEDGMDMSVVNIDYRKQTLTYASARSYGLLVSGKKVIELEMSKESIGGVKIRGLKRFKQTKLNFKKGDKLYLHSDGFGDQFGGPDGKKFMRKRLKKLLIENAKLPMKEQKRVVENTLKEWMKGHFQVDDITLIGIEL